MLTDHVLKPADASLNNFQTEKMQQSHARRKLEGVKSGLLHWKKLDCVPQGSILEPFMFVNIQVT